MLIGIIFIWIVTAVGLWVVTRIVPGVYVNTTTGLLKAAIVLGLVNAIIRPILWILTLPLTILTFGLFALVINAFTLWLTAKMVNDFEVDSFSSALLAALVMAVLSIIGAIMLSFIMVDEMHWMMYSSGPGMYM